jgi:hypothetical protein
VLGRLDRGVDRAVSAHHDDRHGQQPAGGPFLQQRDAVHIGHPDVEQHEVGTQAIAAGARLGSVFGQLDVVAFVREDFRQQGADAQLVIDYKNGGHERSSMCPCFRGRG